MPHALVGYAGSTVEAARLYRKTFPDEKLTVLIDYFGAEISDGWRWQRNLLIWQRRGAVIYAY